MPAKNLVPILFEGEPDLRRDLRRIAYEQDTSMAAILREKAREAVAEHDALKGPEALAA